MCKFSSWNEKIQFRKLDSVIGDNCFIINFNFSNDILPYLTISLIIFLHLNLLQFRNRIWAYFRKMTCNFYYLDLNDVHIALCSFKPWIVVSYITLHHNTLDWIRQHLAPHHSKYMFLFCSLVFKRDIYHVALSLNKTHNFSRCGIISHLL